MSGGEPSTRRIGRPRAVESTLNIEPVEHILLEAGRLFTEQGFRGTTTREIAEAAGLRQGSLYHYFARKDDILAELLDRTVEAPLQMAPLIDVAGASGAARLWALTFLDVRNYCSGPCNLALLSRLPDAQRPRFSEFWEKRQRLQDWYGRYLKIGKQEGNLRVDDAELMKEFVFGLVESPVAWFDPKEHDSLIVSRVTARSVLLCALIDLQRLADIIEEGRELAARVPEPEPAVAQPTAPDASAD